VIASASPTDTWLTELGWAKAHREGASGKGSERRPAEAEPAVVA